MAPKRESRRGRTTIESSRGGKGTKEEVPDCRRTAKGPVTPTDGQKKSGPPGAMGNPIISSSTEVSKSAANRSTACAALQPVPSSMTFTVTYGKSLPGNECRLHPGGFRKLQAEPGAILCVDIGSAIHRLYVEAFISTTVSSGSIEVSGDVSHLLEHSPSSVTVTVVRAVRQVPSVRSMVASVLLLNTSKLDQQVEGCCSLEWKALLRRHLLHRLCFKGMRTTIQTSLCTLLVDVEKLTVHCETGIQNEADAQYTDFGLLSPGSEIHIVSSGGSIAAEVPDSSNVAVCTLEGSSRVETSQSLNHLLVVGDEGTGKSFVLQEEMERHRQAGRSVLEVAVQSIAKESESEISARVALHDWFDTACRAAPSTLVFDDLHLICSSSTSTVVGSAWVMNLIARGFTEAFQRIRSMNQDVCILASAISCDRLHPLLSHPSTLGPFIRHLEIPATIVEKVNCMQRAVLDVTGFRIPSFTPPTTPPGASSATASLSREDLCHVAEATNGYSQRDYRTLIELAAARSFQKRCALECTAEEIMECAKQIQPSALKQFDISIPDVTWSDIGGSEAAKQVLQDVVGWALGKQKDIFEEFHLTPPRGVLLYGPPGCSKTMLAKALANESHLNFISVKGPEVFSKWVGDSEKAVRNIFTRARAASPCVVFIDELDGMCGHRGQGGVSDRVISQFLTELDGLPTAMSEKEHALIFVAATNRPDNIDGAVLRPGRIDRLVHVGLPSYEERRAIASIQFRKMPISDNLTPEFIASKTEGYSGAEVVAVIKEAAFHALSVSINCEHVTLEDISAALKKVRPRTKQEDVEWYLTWGRTKIAS